MPAIPAMLINSLARVSSQNKNMGNSYCKFATCHFHTRPDNEQRHTTIQQRHNIHCHSNVTGRTQVHCQNFSFFFTNIILQEQNNVNKQKGEKKNIKVTDLHF